MTGNPVNCQIPGPAGSVRMETFIPLDVGQAWGEAGGDYADACRVGAMRRFWKGCSVGRSLPTGGHKNAWCSRPKVDGYLTFSPMHSVSSMAAY